MLSHFFSPEIHSFGLTGLALLKELYHFERGGGVLYKHRGTSTGGT